MEEKRTAIAQKESSKLPRLFNQAGKYIRFERYNGTDIREQSRRNFKALLERLKNRTQVPEAERANYGAARFSEKEAQFLRFWHGHIIPLFTARHGTEQFAYIQHAGCMMSVADRRRASSTHQNSRTGGVDRQDYIYFVLGIGAKHPVPTSVSNSKTITIHFDRMRPEEKQQYAGMFISGHDADYQRNITYPIIMCGTTEFKVSYDAKAGLRTTTFTRTDGTLITEILTPAEEIVAADPSIDVIFEWLGYKMIEYLRFIGGDFQEEILGCNDVDKIATVFHALFPSYRFPELKIPLKKIPINADYVEVSKSSELSHKEVSAFHQACMRSDLRKLNATINPMIASAPGKDDDTPLSVLTKEYRQISCEVVQLLLDNNADPNAGTLIDSNLSRALNKGDPQLIAILMRGSSHPHCRNLRLLPKVGYIELKAIIASHRLDLFTEFYPQYLKYEHPQKLLRVACNSTLESAKEYANNTNLNDESQKHYQTSRCRGFFKRP